MRQIKEVTLYEGEQYDGDFPTDTYSGSPLLDVIGWFTKKYGEIPEQFRDSATCEFSSASDYDSHCACITIKFKRPETDLEMELREQRVRDARAAARNSELRVLEELKRKYPDAV